MRQQSLTDNSCVKSYYFLGLLLHDTFPLKTVCAGIVLHMGDAVAALALWQGLHKASCCCLHTVVHCGMLLLQEMEQRQDRK